MNRCERCGRRWCICIPGGASVEYMAAVVAAPALGPYLRGMDPAIEILEAVADIAAMPASEWGPHIHSLSGSCTTKQLVEALLVAMERCR